MKTKQHTPSRHHLRVLPAAVAGLLAACGQAPEQSAPPNAGGPALESFLLGSAPENAVPVARARANVRPGEPITLTGQVGGTEQPFTDGHALMVIADSDLVFCDEMEDDHCPTPWDACCEDPEKLRASRATIQLVDAEGAPVRGSLRGLGGLAELDTVVVQGRVAPGSNTDNLIVNATGIHVRDRPAGDEGNTARPHPVTRQ